MKFVPIGDLVERSRQCDPRELRRDRFKYIDISSVDREAKRIVAAQCLTTAQAPSRARKQVRAGDVILSTVRPNLNAVALVQPQFDGEIASTGFAVLRAKPTALDPRYLFYFLQTERLVAHLTRIATGASYPAISDEDALHTPIPLPALPEQKRIAAILERADRLRRLRRYAVEMASGVLAAAFLRLFVENGKDYPACAVEDLAVQRPGSMRTGPFGSQLLHSEFTGSGVAVLGIDNVVQNRFAWDQRRFITPEKYATLKRYTVFPRDVLISIMGTCGRCAIVPDNIPTAINTKHLCCITLEETKCLPEYLHGCFLYHPAVLKSLGVSEKGAIMPGLNMEIIKDVRIPLPPMKAQQQFAQIIERAEQFSAIHRESLRQGEHLFQTLLHWAFTSGL